MNKQRKVYKHFRQAVLQNKPDLNHGYFLFSGGIQCLWAKREFGIPFVITVQNTDINSIFKYFIHLRGLCRKILEEAELVFFVSDAYRQFALERMIPPEYRVAAEKKFRLLPFALDPFWTEHTDTSKHPEHDGPIRLLTVGVVNALKNQTATAEAVQILRSRGMDIELSVVGQTLDSQIDEKLRRLPFVRRIGKLPKEELIGEYRRADLFVLPSLTESFGLVYAEALSQGVPVIYSAGQGFDKQFPESFVGYRTDAADPESIARSILLALSGMDELQANCEEAALQFTTHKVCADCCRLYEEALS